MRVSKCRQCGYQTVVEGRDLYRGPDVLKNWCPAFCYHLTDLSSTGEMELVGAVWQQAIMAVMRHIGTPDLRSWLPVVMVGLSTAQGIPGLADLWQVVALCRTLNPRPAGGSRPDAATARYW